MALIIPEGDRKPGEIRESGCSGLFESIIASQREGCNRVSIRILTLRGGGHTALLDMPCETVYFVLEGSLLLVDGDGFLSNLSQRDWAVLRPHEKHILRNESEEEVRVIAVRPV